MKKSLLALAVLAGISMLFMGCPSGTDTPTEPTSDPATNVETPVVTSKTLTFSNAYGKAIWNVAEDWTEFTIEFDGVPSKVQICAEGDVTSSANQKWGEMYYTGTIDTASKTVVIADALKALKEKNNDTKVTKICLCANNDASATAKIKSVTAKKSDGSTVTVSAPDTFESAELK